MLIDDQTRVILAHTLRTYRRELNQTRADPNLSERGKRQKMATLYTTTKTVVAEHLADADRIYRTTLTGLEKKLFGTLSDGGSFSTIARRDALDRADRIKTPAEARALLRRCQLHGDTVLAQAVLSRAWTCAQDPATESAWRPIIADYIDNHRPDLREDLHTYDALTRADTSTNRALEAMSTTVVRPRELASITDVEAQRLAEETPAPPPARPASPSIHLDLPPGAH